MNTPAKFRQYAGPIEGYAAYELALGQAELPTPWLVLAPDAATAALFAGDLALFLGGRVGIDTAVYPEDENSAVSGLSPDIRDIHARLGILSRLADRDRKLRAVVTTGVAVAQYTLPPEKLRQFTVDFLRGDTISRDQIAARLADAGYQPVPVVEDIGTFSLRGGIIDVFAVNAELPVRVELLGDEVDRIRHFLPHSQRSVAALDAFSVAPARELMFDADTRVRVKAAFYELASARDLPSSKVKGIAHSLGSGHYAFGLDVLRPAFFETPACLLDYFHALPQFSTIVLHGPSVSRALNRAWADAAADYLRACKKEEPAFPPEKYALHPARVIEGISRRPHWHFAKLATGVAAPGEDRSTDGGGDGGTEPPDGEITSIAAPEWPANVTYEQPLILISRASALRKEIESACEDPISPLLEWIVRARKTVHGVVAVTSALSHAEKLATLLKGRGIQARIVNPKGELVSPLEIPAEALRSVPVHIIRGTLSHGFTDNARKFAILSESDIFGARKAASQGPTTAKIPGKGPTLRELEPGNAVVHVEHGISRYRGLTKLVVNGVEGDYLHLEYAGGDRLYLPVTRMNLLRKYSAAAGENARLDKLGGQTWAAKTRKVKDSVLRMAGDLLRLYALRASRTTPAFGDGGEIFGEFEAEFPFEETPDQEAAIKNVLGDLHRGRPMDRLICGDVGFGKTEVAMRAAMLAVLSKKQVAVLVPTTVLAQQHYRTFSERMRNFAVNVEVVSRFRTAPEQKEILQKLAEGKLDVIIGTHRLLSSDVKFKDLGLVIVDEEQRFGVAHKERFKKMRLEVNILTLSATPIPRTMNMAMSGVRDMSIIATPPSARLPVRTYLTKFDSDVIREAIQRELHRGGQTYFVHNRVQSIAAMHRYLTELMPGLSVGIAHGQMNEKELENIMVDLVDRKIQVLLCTTLIESGIDVPSVNTIIINRADKLGLAQLHQLRGRVGRSHLRGYCYLMVKNVNTMTSDAERRLEAIQEHQELGAGFHIASEDLEIRGSGNLLGADQSGNIAAVGFDMYTDLVRSAIEELRGQGEHDLPEVELDIHLPAIIPQDYIRDVHERLEYYQRISLCPGPAELDALFDEMMDRYGALPEETENLRDGTALKFVARGIGVRKLDIFADRAVLGFDAKASIDPAKAVTWTAKFPELYRLTPDGRLTIRTPAKFRSEAVAQARRAMEDFGRAAQAPGKGARADSARVQVARP